MKKTPDIVKCKAHHMFDTTPDANTCDAAEFIIECCHRSLGLNRDVWIDISDYNGPYDGFCTSRGNRVRCSNMWWFITKNGSCFGGEDAWRIIRLRNLVELSFTRGNMVLKIPEANAEAILTLLTMDLI